VKPCDSSSETVTITSSVSQQHHQYREVDYIPLTNRVACQQSTQSAV